MKRRYRRDRLGRFASGGTKLSATAGGVKKAAKAATTDSAKKVGGKVGDAYVAGSFTKHLEIGQGGSYKGVKVGAEFCAPSGRAVMVKGIAGYHGKLDRRLDVTPKLDKAQKKLTVTARPNPARPTPGKKVRR